MRSLEPYDPYLLTAYKNENGVAFFGGVLIFWQF